MSTASSPVQKQAIPVLPDWLPADAVPDAQRELLRVTLAGIGDAVITTDAQGRVTFLNPAAQSLTGWTREEAAGSPPRSVFRLVNEQTRLPVEDPVNLALCKGTVVGLANPTLLIARDGTEQPVDGHASPIRDEHGNVAGAVLIFRAVSERRRQTLQAKHTPHGSTPEFRRLLEKLPAAAYTCDAEGLITYFNKHAIAIWGREPKLNDTEDRFCGSFKLFSPSGSPLAHDQCWMALALRENKEYNGLELAIERPDGSRVTVLAHANPFHDESGILSGAVNVLVDVTERKRTEKALQEADRLKNEFLAMLAHELRNPLAPIRNAVHILRLSGPAGDDLPWVTEVIERQVQQLTRLVDDLLDVSRIMRGQINLQLGPVDLTEVMMRAVEISRPLIDDRKHRLEVSLPDQPVRLQADPARLAQVVSNLLNNAAKYTDAGGRIWLTVELASEEGQPPEEVLIRVRDTGRGIPRELLPKVFDLFTQGERTLDRTQGGLGIGLTLVRRLVELHAGRVTAFSAGPGQGSEFVVRLPLVRKTFPADVKESAQGEAVKVPSRRILVVDDNVESAKTLARLLRMMGHEVRTVHDGMAALEAAQDGWPQVVLLDIGLPGLDGLEVARRLRQDPGLQDTLLVAMTGYGQDEDRHHSQEAGFNAHLVKPLDLEALQTLLARPEAGGSGR
jgi:PAS domain S-box-containing protein